MHCLKCQKEINEGDLAYRYRTDDEDDDGNDLGVWYGLCDPCCTQILFDWVMDKICT